MQQAILAAIAVVVVLYFWNPSRTKISHKKFVIGGVLVAALALTVPGVGVDYYRILGVSPTASHAEIRQARDLEVGRLLALGLGPQDASVTNVKRVSEAVTRNQFEYDHYGDFFISGAAPKTESALSRMVALSLLNALFTYILSYALTFPRLFRHARGMMALWSLCLVLFELRERMSGHRWDLLGSLYILPFQKIELSRRLFPFILGSAVCISSWLQDGSDDSVLKYQLRGIFEAQQLMLQQTNELLKKSSG